MALRRDRMSEILSSLAVSRVLYIRNLPTNITSEVMENNFGKFGEIELIKIENIDVEYVDKSNPKKADVADKIANATYKKAVENTDAKQDCETTDVSAYVTYVEKKDAKEACENLSGSDVFGAKLIVTYYQKNQINKKIFSRTKNYKRRYYYYFEKKKEYL